MRKASGPKREIPAWRPHDRIARQLASKSSHGVRVVEFGVHGLRHSAQGR